MQQNPSLPFLALVIQSRSYQREAALDQELMHTDSTFNRSTGVSDVQQKALPFIFPYLSNSRRRMGVDVR
jgi:hypothetical protein